MVKRCLQALAKIKPTALCEKERTKKRDREVETCSSEDVSVADPYTKTVKVHLHLFSPVKWSHASHLAFFYLFVFSFSHMQSCLSKRCHLHTTWRVPMYSWLQRPSMWNRQAGFAWHELKDRLRGAWRDHCFPAPFSWFLHETGLESLKITPACCFSLKCQRKVSKKAKEHRQFCGVLGRWRTAAIDRTTFYASQRCRRAAVFAVFFFFFLSALGVIWRVKAFRDQQCQFLTRNKSLSSENESNCSMTSECVCTDSILPRGAGCENGRCKQSIFSLLLSSSMQGLKYIVTDFLSPTCQKVMIRQSRPCRVKQRLGRFFVHISTSREKLKIL